MSKNFRNNKFSKENEQKEFDDQIEGRNAVLELLESGKDINKIYITKGEKHGSITKIIAKAKERKIVTVEVEREKINQMAQTENAQGVIAIVPPFDYCEVEDILNEAKSRNEKAFILILDGIEDPHNLGSIIRTAETAGVHGIIIPKRRAAAVNSTVVKTSAGATSFMKVARVNNINETIKYLKENMEVTILSYKGNVFAVEPPIFVELEVIYTEPGFAGNTTTTSGKPATLETGLELQVPMFVNIGDVLRIDTRTCEYMERV